MHTVHPGLHDEGLQVTNLNYPVVLSLAHGVTFPAQGTSSERPEGRHTVFISCLQITRRKACSDTENSLA